MRWISATFGNPGNYRIYRGCITIYRVENGFLFKVWLLFGGNYRLILDRDIRVTEENPATFFGYRKLVMNVRNERMEVSGKGCSFILKHHRPMRSTL